MTYPDVFSIILLYTLLISIVVQSKLPTDHFVKIIEKRNNIIHNKEHISRIISKDSANIKEVTLILIIIFLSVLYKFSLLPMQCQ